MVNPRGKITRSRDPAIAYGVLGEPDIEIAAWCPDTKAQLPPEQVHLIIHIHGLDIPIVIRFKSPDTLGFLIEEIASYRREVWPDAEPLDLESPIGGLP